MISSGKGRLLVRAWALVVTSLTETNCATRRIVRAAFSRLRMQANP